MPAEDKMLARAARAALRVLAVPRDGNIPPRFFKTGPGDYAEKDQFLELTVPQVRQVARRFQKLPLPEVESLLGSQTHEDRSLALILLVERFGKSSERDRKKIAALYLRNVRHVNNWDLVDLSAAPILGAYLKSSDRKLLVRFARSKNLWQRRIAIVSTFFYIRRDDFACTLRLAEILLGDEHDLIHKAVGWMLREVGKRDEKVLKTFLKRHHSVMPRTMLRYAIERFPPEIRAEYRLRKAP